MYKNRIKELMEMNRLTVTELSRICNIKHQVISGVLKRENLDNTALKVLEPIANALGVSIEELFEENEF